MPGGHAVLPDLSAALERATDAYAKACDETAVAQNSYLLAFHRAWMDNRDVPASIRIRDADNHMPVVEARSVLISAKAVERSSKAKMAELKDRMIAAMSLNKFYSAQD